jgi:uroporphyrinogen-III synthase
MATNKLLNGIKVLITRPQQQAKDLCKRVNDTGAIAIFFPVIEIVPIPYEQWSECEIDKQDLLIFISRNAVSNFVGELTDLLPKSIQLAAVGRGTAELMKTYNLRVDIQPVQSSGSEGLLAVPELQDVVGKNIVIVRGKGGRELLAESLAARGAKIEYIEVYERILASPSALQYQQALNADCIVCTSVMGVQNLHALLKGRTQELLEKPMIVVSERIRHHALSLGFENIVVTTQVSDQAIVHQLIEMERE